MDFRWRVAHDGAILGYEVMNGNTSDRTTLRDFLKKIEETHGKAQRVWVMDRCIECSSAAGRAHRHTLCQPPCGLAGLPARSPLSR
jgi:hypothetical protein